MLPLWAQWLSLGGVVALVISGISAAVVTWFKVVRRLDRIERSLDQVRHQGNGHLAMTGSLVNALNRQGVITTDEMAEIVQNFVELAEVPSAPNNPLSPNEYARLVSYIQLARTGGPFTPDQVRDYQALVAQLEEERPRDNNVWALVGLGALLLGMYLLGKRDE